jgi:hypothetical protein
MALVAGGLGFGALLHRRRNRRSISELAPSPADDLRAKLAEGRATPAFQAAVAEPPHANAPDQEGARDEPEVPTTDLDSRRQGVHDRARAALDDLA